MQLCNTQAKLDIFKDPKMLFWKDSMTKWGNDHNFWSKFIKSKYFSKIIGCDLQPSLKYYYEEDLMGEYEAEEFQDCSSMCAGDLINCTNGWAYDFSRKKVSNRKISKSVSPL